MNKSWLIALAALTLAACQTTAGTGSGNVRGTQKPVAFTWQSESTDNDSGAITATFGSGRVFKGSYVQIDSDTRFDSIEPLWVGWDKSDRRGNWRYWEPSPAFYKQYNGRVLANLHADDGEAMRCRFTLISPSRGMAGGGEGRCQLSENSQEITAEFPRQG